MMTTHRIGRLAREAFLTIGAVLGVICVLMTVASAAFGVKPLVFRSGSMAPAIHTGDLSIARTVAATSLEKGDIVSVMTAGGSRVTHRVVAIAGEGDVRQLTLKGDANSTNDAEAYAVEEVERVVLSVPKAGHVVNAATSPAGVFVLGLYVAGMLVLLIRGGGAGRGEPTDPTTSRPGGTRKAPRRRRSRAIPRAVVAVVAGSVTMVGAPAVAAPWIDDVPITGAVITGGTLASPGTSVGCVNSAPTGSFVDLSWSASPLAQVYRIVLTADYGASITLPDIAAGTLTRRVANSEVAALLQVNTTITVRVFARAGTSWVSTGSASRTIKVTSVVFLTSVTCT